MSYAVGKPQASSPASNEGPPSTATVYDFICLFTHDLRRKQKRWQDGKLKYHSFNKKVMVYDDRGQFVGDAHWDQEGDLAPGDELSLDRGMAMVQVEDCTGEKQQDLTDLLDKRAREVEKRRQIAAAKTRPTPRGSLAGGAQPPLHRPHLPLSSLVQSPGPIGRAAIPAHSPFESRQQKLHQNQPPNADAQPTVVGRPPPAKKRRTSTSPPSKAGFARNLFGTTLSLSSCPGPELLAARARALRQRMLLQAEVSSTPQQEEETEEQAPVQSSPLFLQDDTDATPSRPAKEKRSTLPPVTRHPIVSARSVMREAQEVGNRNMEPAIDNEGIVQQENFSKKQRKETRKQSRPTEAVDLTSQDADVETELMIQEKPPKKKRKDKDSSQSRKPQQTEERIQETRNKKPTATRRSSSLDSMTINEPDEVEEAPLPRKAPKKSQRESKEREKAPQEPSLSPERESKAKEPRTTLRMRSRQKRGLLMIREPSLPPQESPVPVEEEMNNRVVKTPSPEPSVSPPRQMRSVSPEEVIVPSSAPFVAEISETVSMERIPTPALPVLSSEDDLPQAYKRRARKRRKCSPAPARIPENSLGGEEPEKKTGRQTTKRNVCKDKEDENSVADKELQPRKRRAAKRNVHNEATGVEFDEAEEEPDKKTQQEIKKRDVYGDEAVEEEQDPQARKPRAAKRSAYTEETGSELEENGEVNEIPEKQGPRIAKLPRKGIRSREILGYVAQGIEELIPGPFASGSFRLGGPPVPAVRIAAPAEPVAVVSAARPITPAPVELVPVESSLMQKKGASLTMADSMPSEQVLAPSFPLVEKPADPALFATVPKSATSSSVELVPAAASPIEEKPAFSSHPVPEELAAVPLETVASTISPQEPVRSHAITAVSRAADAIITTEGIGTVSRRDAALEAPPSVVRSNSSSNAVAPTTTEANEIKLKALSAPEMLLAKVPESTTAQASENAASSETEKKLEIVLQASAVSVPMEVLPVAESMSSGSETNQAAKPRIANPASRGKKAARREDAAGLAPQVMVPLEPVQPVVARIISTRPGGGVGRGRIAAAGPLALCPVAPPPPPGAVSAPVVAKKAASMPGFTSASGGTWSRHAHDLLGMNRPERRS